MADAYGGYNGVVAGNEHHARRVLGPPAPEVIDAEKTAPEIAREAVEMVRSLYAVEKQARDPPAWRGFALRHDAVGPGCGRTA